MFDNYGGADVATYVDGDGAIWDSSHAECPRCTEPTQWGAGHQAPNGYFHCSACGLTYDEPNFDDPESAFVGSLPVCPVCGEFVDYCSGHGELGDPWGARVLRQHDNGDHRQCHPRAYDAGECH